MKEIKWKILLLTLFVGLISANIKLEIGKKVDGSNVEGVMSYYEVTLPENYDYKSDLVIKASATDDRPYDNPDIFLSTVDKAPKIGSSILGCSSMGEDICILGKEGLEPK